ncbi:MAG: DUF4132 domain-containing protein [Roseivirga sp.]|nr:DUF4132 domain-containing protein [Roseivirga sp.]
MGLKDFLKELTSRTPEKSTSELIGEKIPVERNKEFQNLLDQIYDRFTRQDDPYWKEVRFSELPEFKSLKKEDDKYKIQFIYYLIINIEAEKQAPAKKGITHSMSFPQHHLKIRLLEQLFKTKTDFGEKDLKKLLTHFCLSIRETRPDLTVWPLGYLVMQVTKRAERTKLSALFQAFLKGLINGPEFEYRRVNWGPEMPKLKRKLMKLLPAEQGAEPVAPVYRLSEHDNFGHHVNQVLEAMSREEALPWHEFFYHAVKASGGKPAQDYAEVSQSIIQKIGQIRFKAVVNDTIATVIGMEVKEFAETLNNRSGEYIYRKQILLHDKNATVLKGMVWSMVHFHDTKTLTNLAGLTERCFKKIPGVGPAAAGVGNAAIYVLAHSKGLEGISHLSRLKLKISQNNTRKLIQKYLEEASAKRGISAQEIEEMSIPDFGLTAGQKEVSFADYTLRIAMAGVGKTQMTWLKPDGKVQKTPPAFIRENKKLSDLLRKLKAELRQIQKYSTAQRDRIDRSFILDRSMSYEHFVKYYHHHGLVSAISRRLLWNFKTENQIYAGIWHNDQWEDLDGNQISILPEATEVNLWHPIDSATEVVLAWRDKLDSLSWQQPIKQVYREIYLLTDAEVNTVVYSNRMAAHILKQHQFKALSAIRNWNYQLLGCYDDGREGEVCRLSLPHWGINVEYWINEVYMEDAFNDAGIWDCVATDQLRFMNQSDQAIPLIDVPKIVFSEAMRDADLFVGVASVGNDPAWVDSGGNVTRQHNDYWQSYSFGDLNKMAKTRKEVLERLVPRLKIRDVVRIDGKFLRVRGMVREYKIHIGSTNILMEPNDQYLCIVPARGKGMDTGNLFIPFEGDRGLSLVLSKAMLLAADDKITDSTILSQIRR